MKFGDLQRRGGSEPLSEERSLIKFGDLRPRTSTQTEPEKAGGSILDTAKDLFDFTPAGMVYNFITSPAPHFLGGAAAETAGNVANRLGQEFGGNSWRRRALDSMSDSAQKIADTALEIGRNRVDTSDDGSVHDVFANGFLSNFLGNYGNLARMIHADKSADAMIKASESLANKQRVSTDDLGEYFTNPYGFVSDFANLGGSMIAAAPFSAALPIRALPLALRYGAGAGLFESAVEGGETRGNLLAGGASEDEATRASLVTAGKNLPLLLATNSLEGLALLSPPGGANKLLQIGGRAALNSAQEQYEEFIIGRRYATHAGNCSRVGRRPV